MDFYLQSIGNKTRKCLQLISSSLLHVQLVNHSVVQVKTIYIHSSITFVKGWGGVMEVEMGFLIKG